MNKKDGIGKIKLHQKKFLKEKKIVCSIERLAVRAVNDSKAGIGKIIMEHRN